MRRWSSGRLLLQELCSPQMKTRTLPVTVLQTKAKQESVLQLSFKEYRMPYKNIRVEGHLHRSHSLQLDSLKHTKII